MENEDWTETSNGNGLTAEHNEQYVAELINERQNMGTAYIHAAKLLDREISNVQSGNKEHQLLELHNDKPTRVTLKVRIPAKEYPKFNFIGKIIGPKGNSLRRIQEETECRMAVYGRGSMRDKEKEEELRQQGGKYAHLNDDLHVHVESFGHPIDVYRRLSFALHALRQHLVPDYNDEVTQMQVQELAALTGTVPAAVAGRGAGRGSAGASRGGPYSGRGRTESAPTPRGRGATGSNGRGALAFGQAATSAVPSRFDSPPQAPPMTSYPNAYQYEVGLNKPMATQDFDGRNAENATGSALDLMSLKSPSAALGFNSQTGNAYNALSSGGWGNDSSVGGKAPLTRSTIGQTRNHPYAYS